MFNQYSLGDIRRTFQNPRLVPMEFNRFVHTRGRRWKYNHAGMNVLSEDWDTLLILDACRYDMFAEISSLPGNLEERISVGSNTYEWLRGTFDGQDLQDTIYVTANPQLYRINEGIYDISESIDVSFYDVVELWDECWDDDFRTVRPKTVSDTVMHIYNKYPNKRLIVHFVQPHFPFIGPTGQEHFAVDHFNFDWESYTDVPLATMRQAYRENLEIVLTEVEYLLNAISGRTVVTADHGEALGDCRRPIPIRMYAHRLNHYIESLVRVPWLIYENGERRAIAAENSEMTTHDIDDAVVKERLRNLGYS